MIAVLISFQQTLDTISAGKLYHFPSIADMAPFYEEVCADLGWTVDQGLLDQMKAANESKLQEIDRSTEDAEKNLGETEVRDSMLKKAEYLSRIGAKVRFLTVIYYIVSIIITQKSFN